MNAARSYTNPTPVRYTEREPDVRPPLEVVRAKRPTGVIAAVTLVMVFSALLATAAFNTMLVSGQRNLDDIETQIREGELENDVLRAERSQLRTPDRIIAEAEEAGMIVPDQVQWIAPQPDGTSVADNPVPPQGDERASGLNQDGEAGE